MVAADLVVFCRSARLELPPPLPLPEVWPAVFRDDLLFFFGELGLCFLAAAGTGWPPLALFRFAVVVAADVLVFSFGFGLCAVFGENFEGAFEFGLLLLLLLFPPLAFEVLPSFVFGGEPYAAAFIGCRAFGCGGKCIMWYAT
jgi:hypothetical protein